jgi:hypothetical protein
MGMALPNQESVTSICFNRLRRCQGVRRQIAGNPPGTPPLLAAKLATDTADHRSQDNGTKELWKLHDVDDRLMHLSIGRLSMLW